MKEFRRILIFLAIISTLVRGLPDVTELCTSSIRCVAVQGRRGKRNFLIVCPGGGGTRKNFDGSVPLGL